MPPHTTSLTSQQSATRLSTMGIVLISVAGAVLLVVLVVAVILFRRRRKSCLSPESRWRSVWILCRRRRQRQCTSTVSHVQHYKHNRKHSTASTLHDCRVVMHSTNTSAPQQQQWYLQGSPQQEITDPYEVDGYHKAKYIYPQDGFYQPNLLDCRRDSMATTLVATSQRPSPLRSTFNDGGDESLFVPSTFGGNSNGNDGSSPFHLHNNPYPFGPSEPNSPVYTHFQQHKKQGDTYVDSLPQRPSPIATLVPPPPPPIRPSAMTRQISEAPSVPRSVSPSSPVEVEVEQEFVLSTSSSPKRPRLQRGTVTPRITISASPPEAMESSQVDTSVSVVTATRPSYFSPPLGTKTLTSPGLHTAFRSAFFLDAGPQRAIAINSMPQTPAVDE